MLWFLVSGAARFALAVSAVIGAALLTGVVDLGVLLAVFGVTAVYAATALGIAPALKESARRGRWRLLVGRGQAAAIAFKILAVGGLLGLVAGVVLFGLVFPDVGLWISERGGGGSIYLTLSVVLLVVLAASALARLVCAPLALWPAARAAIPDSKPARAWESVDAAALLCSALLCVYGIALGAAGADAHWTRVDESGEAIRPGEPTRSLENASDRDILVGLAPILSLSHEEGWYPQRVDAYLDESVVVDLDGREVARSPAVGELPSPCPGSRKPCLLVRNDRCPATDACREWRVDEVGSTVADPRVVGYGRVVRRGGPGSRTVRWDASPFGTELTGIAQWWLFAPYNEWITPMGVVAARLFQRHAADWEAITIGFSDERPLFLALSAHCGGSWRRFEDVVVFNTGAEQWDPLATRLHPTAAYADGSHALYFEPEDGRNPDSVGCELDSASGLFGPVAYAANVRDRTAESVSVILEPVLGAESLKVLELPAYWGRTEEIELEAPVVGGTQVKGTVAKPKGPSGPGTKILYRDPVGTVFCSRTWHHDGTRAGSADCD